MNRAERRRRTFLKVEKRKKHQVNCWRTTEVHFGKLRSSSGGCSCWMCKPHKYGLEPKHKPSELRKLQKYDQTDL